MGHGRSCVQWISWLGLATVGRAGWRSGCSPQTPPLTTTVRALSPLEGELQFPWWKLDQKKPFSNCSAKTQQFLHLPPPPSFPYPFVLVFPSSQASEKAQLGLEVGMGTCHGCGPRDVSLGGQGRRSLLQPPGLGVPASHIPQFSLPGCSALAVTVHVVLLGLSQTTTHALLSA